MRIALLLVALLAAAPSFAADVPYADVEARAVRLPKLAVPPPRSLDAAPAADTARELGEVVVFDMNFSGVVAAEAFEIPAQNNGIALSDSDFVPWLAGGFDYVLRSEFSTKGDELTVEFRLYSVAERTMMAAKRYLGKTRDLRRFSHSFADEILLAMTGERGCFTTRIAYVSTQSRNKEIAVMDWDGHNPVALTRNGSINLNPDFSPDGRELLFTSYKNGNPDLFRRALSSTAELSVSRYPGLNVTGTWSPDGTRIALTLSKDGNSEIYLLSKEGKNPVRLTVSPSIEVSPAWSPDGTRIVFVSDRLGKPQLFTMNVDGGNVRRLTSSGSYNVNPRWSPKGDRIAYARQSGNGFQIYTIKSDGSGDTQLTNSGSNENPSWSPDGRFITFSSRRNGAQAIYVMRADGSGQTRVSQGGGSSSQPVWSPR